MQEIILPESKVNLYKESYELESNSRWLANGTFQEIEKLNERFFRACRDRINRKMRRANVSCSLIVRLADGGDEIYAVANLEVYLGSNQVANLICRLTKTNDSDKMCEMAIKIHNLREPALTE